MAIKTKTSRATYRSNVKERPLRQNGLEAQYQGLDISEVNIDHGGLCIIGRGGHQTRRDIRKVRKQYVVDVPQEEHNPTAELVFLSSVNNSPFDHNNWDPSFSLQDLDGETFIVNDQDNTGPFTFQFTNVETNTNGEVIPLSNPTAIAVNIFENNFSKRDLMFAITGSIEAVFPEDTFRFELYPSGSKQRQYGYPEPVTILEDKIVLILSSSVTGSAVFTGTSNFIGDTNNFDDQSESHEWRLNGFLPDTSNPTTFYEDLRTDTIQSTEPHSFRSESLLFRAEQFSTSDVQENYKNFYDREISNIATDPKGEPRFTKHDSSEVLIRQFPKREEVFDTYRGNHQWREDIHYLSPDQQVWSRMEALATNYHSSLTAHIEAMMNSNFADEQYIDTNPLSGRVDVLNRLSRIFDTNTDLVYERHPFSVFDQFLDPIDDFINLQENRFPKEDLSYTSAYFEDVKGTFEEERIRPATTSTFEYVHTGTGSNYFNNFTVYLPDVDNRFTVMFGGGTSHITTWSTTANPGVGPLIRIVTYGVNPIAPNPDDVVSIIVEAFEDLRINPVNGFDFSNYTITKDTTGPFPKFTIEGLGYSNRIELEPGHTDGPDQEITVKIGRDTFQHGGEIVEDFFDQEPLDNHDFVEEERWTRIDDEMLDILTFNANRGTHIDTREWQESDYIYTSTGFINSQQSGQDGIIYREMKR